MKNYYTDWKDFIKTFEDRIEKVFATAIVILLLFFGFFYIVSGFRFEKVIISVVDFVFGIFSVFLAIMLIRKEIKK